MAGRVPVVPLDNSDRRPVDLTPSLDSNYLAAVQATAERVLPGLRARFAREDARRSRTQASAEREPVGETNPEQDASAEDPLPRQRNDEQDLNDLFADIGLDPPSPRGRDRAKDQLRHEENLRRILPSQQKLFLATAPQWLDRRRRLQAASQASYEDAIAAYVSHPIHQCGESFGVGQSSEVRERRLVALHQLGMSFSVSLPTISCGSCQQTFEMPPVALRCFGSSPVRPSIIYEESLLAMFHALSFRAGASATSVVTCLTEAASSLMLGMGAWAPPQLLDDQGFLNAYRSYRATVRSALIQPSCLDDCFMQPVS